MRPRLGMLLFLALVVSVGVRAQNNPLIGTWKENLAKSQFNPGPPPKGATTTKITAAAGGIRVVSDGVNADGQKTHTDVTAKFDGKEYPRKAMAGGKPDTTVYDSIAVKKTDAYNYEITEKMNGQMFGVVRWTISQDGKTRTITGTGKNAQGQTTNNVTVWDRQ
jgi:hypothetical protein